MGALNHYPNFRTSFLPKNTPDIFKTFVSVFPSEIFNAIGMGLTLGVDILKKGEKGVKKDLENLSLILQSQPYLVGDNLTLADLTVAALTTIVKFPPVAYFDLPLDLENKGIPGIADNGVYESFFTWRDRIYADYRQPVDKSNSNNFNSDGDNQPTSIEIE
jgi:glutathione S-transferase